MRQSFRGSPKFYRRGIALYPEEQLYKEMAFISYYFHWGEDEVLKIEHLRRRRWCQEISAINQSLNPSEHRREKSITEMIPTKNLW